MSLQDETIFGSPGDIVCRKTVWTDVVKFFLLNYGLHAVTIITRPGMGSEATAFTILAGLLCPLSGATRAIGAMQLITRLKSRQVRARRRGDTVPGLFDNKLTVAHCAGALFMLVPWRLNENFGGPPAGYQGLVNIHGQIPFPERAFYQRPRAMIGVPLDGSITIGQDGNPGQRYGLVPVPWNFEVSPLLKEFPNGRRTEISCDHSIIKPLAAIFQICYGSFELYEARGSQIDRFGYAAYSFTVIPYIVMSFMNLVAAMCRPSYPYIYLVHYGDKPEQTDVKEGGVFVTRPFAEDSPVVTEVAPIAMQVSEGGNMNTHRHECVRESEALISGAVGCAHIMKDLDVSRPPSRPAGRRILVAIVGCISALVITLILAAPTYIIIYLLSNFESRQSTTAQRVWIISSLVISSASFVILLAISNLFHFLYPPATDGTAPAAGTPWRGLRAAIPSLNLTALLNIYFFLISIPALGAFVVVAQMMLEHETCVRI